MGSDELIKVLKFIFRANGVKKSSIFARWSVFACPFWGDSTGRKVGFKVMAYRGVDSSKTRVAKMVANHALNCFVSGVGAGATGLGAVGSGVSTAGGKWGGLKDAFNVDIGAVQLSTVLEGSNDPNKIANAIIASGKMLLFGIVRVDKSPQGWTLYFRADTRPNGYTEWGVNNISHIEDNSTRYNVYPNGLVMQNARIIGNYKTGKKAKS